MKPCTVILTDRSYCLRGESAEDIRIAKAAGTRFVTVTTDCCAGQSLTFELDLQEVSYAIFHGTQVVDDEPAAIYQKVIPFNSLQQRREKVGL